MTCTFLARLLGGSFVVICLPILAAQSGEATVAGIPEDANTQRIDFGPGGAIHIDGLRGVLRVEAWDRLEVAITITEPLGSAHRAESPRFSVERKSSSELTISAAKSSGAMEYEIQVPRDSALVIHHRVGLVSVNGVTGDIDATCRRGDLILWLAEKTSGSIDAATTVGTVASGLAGKFSVRYPAGQRFSRVNPSSQRRIRLRTHFGGITIQPMLTESTPPDAVSAKTDGIGTFFH